MTKTPTRRQRPLGVLPPGYTVTPGGRPYWRPSPALRKAGWVSLPLKNSLGDWMDEGPAIQRAREIAEVVAAWRLGVPVPQAFAFIAPGGMGRAAAAQEEAAKPQSFKRLDPHSIGAMIDAYKASPDFTTLSPKTQYDYSQKLRRFCEVLGDPTGGSKPSAIKTAATRALSIDQLAAPERDSTREFQLEVVYEAFRRDNGEHMAHGVMATVSAWLSYCVRRHRIWPANPAKLIKRKVPDGRIVIWEQAELDALRDKAEELGYASIADAIVLAVDLSWSQQDLLALQWIQISAEGRVKHRRLKTNQVSNPPLGALGKARIELIRARLRQQNMILPYVIVCETTGQPWRADHFRHVFAEIRGELAKTMPAVAGKTFRDLRDTAITMFIDGGLTLEETCSRSQHQPTRAQAVIQKHYGMIRQSVADAAAVKLDAHRASLESGTPEPPPATPPPASGPRLKLVKS
jgi:hypothetical protein